MSTRLIKRKLFKKAQFYIALLLMLGCYSISSYAGWNTQNINAIISKSPSCVYSALHSIDCFGTPSSVTTFNHYYWDSRGFIDSTSFPIPYYLHTRPECLSFTYGRIDCFVNHEHHLMHYYFYAGSWQSEDLGGDINSDPSCVSWGYNRLDCFARGWDNSLHHIWWGGSYWGRWEILGGDFIGEPNCVSWGPSRIDCFTRGNDAHMHHKWYGGYWGAWEDLGGILISRPDCVSWGVGRIDCFARGADSAMHHRWWNGSAWGGWESIGGNIKEEPDCISWGPNRLDCFARNPDNNIIHTWWDGTNWGGQPSPTWELLSTGGFLSRPECFSTFLYRIDCILPAGSDSRRLYYR